MKEKFIESYDNIIPEYLSDFLYKEVFETKNNKITIPWSYTKNITSSDYSKDYPGFSHSLINTQLNYISLFKDLFSQVLYRLCFHNNILLRRILNARLFLNFPVPNTNKFSFIHNDLEENHWVCLYYINSTDGDTIFYDDNMKEIKRVSPKKGRIVFFDGSIKHTGSYPTMGSRAIANFNFQGYKFGKEEKN